MSQCQSLYNLLKDGQPRRTDQILRDVYGGEHLGIARIGARVWDLKKSGHEIKSWRDPDKPSLWWYQLLNPPAPPPKVVSQLPLLEIKSNKNNIWLNI